MWWSVATDETVRRSRELARTRGRVFRRREAEPVSGRLLNVLGTFEGLVLEIGGLSGRYSDRSG